MTKQVMQFRICDNHPDGPDIPAVVTENLALNGAKVALDLCQDCSDELYSSYLRWADLGTPIGSGTVFDGQRKLTGPLVINLDAPKPAAPDRRVVLSEEDIIDEPALVEPRPRSKSPLTAHRWIFSDHAMDRMRERNLDVDEVLTAAERPALCTPSKHDLDLQKRKHGDVTAVVNPVTCEIITVYGPKDLDDEADSPAKQAVGAL